MAEELPSNSLTLVNQSLQTLYSSIESLSQEVVELRGDLLSMENLITTLEHDLSEKIQTMGLSIDSLIPLMTASVAAIENLAPRIPTQANIIVSPTVALVSTKILSANPNRLGLIIYNNSANSGYLAYGRAANSSTGMTRILATFTQYVMEPPVYLGDIYAIRNAGTGTFLITELT